ncbi:MAG: hypothetical protein CMJ64_00930 [Planctomycetaceae bacterium]|nr:hypothetical protein [Planctomycetaceae bacterium]
MIWRHLKTILWLRWRMSKNQWRRAGALNAILMAGFVVVALISSVFAFFLGIAGGVFGLAEAEPDLLMFVWDVIILAFLVAWAFGLITELQRSELLSLDKLLHYPLSLSGAFTLNYLTSLFSLTVAVALPGMLGLSIGMVWNHGAPMLLLFPLVLSFFLMVTGVTYQFRGWLATLMENKRRRRAIMMSFTLGVILLTQIPNVVNMGFMGSRNRHRREETQRSNERLIEQTAELNRRLASGDVDVADNARLMKELQEEAEKERQEKRSAARAQVYNGFIHYVVLANQILPMTWLAYGTRQAALGSLWPGLLGLVGMTLIGTASLWRAHRTTMCFYTGHYSKRGRKKKVKRTEAAKPAWLLEQHLPIVNEHVSGVALVAFRSLLRAPESKMALIMPLVMLLIYIPMIAFGDIPKLPSIAAPFIALGVLMLTIFGATQLVVNVFALDRSGFRAYVLMPVPRKDILLGKNLAVVPFVGSITALILLATHIMVPLTFTHAVATILQCLPAYLLLCMMGNLSSILMPMAMSMGTMKAAQPKLVVALVQGFVMMLSPLSLAPAFAAVLAEVWLAESFRIREVPIYLVVTLVELVVVAWVYRRVIAAQAHMLQKREPRILEIVTANVE